MIINNFIYIEALTFDFKMQKHTYYITWNPINTLIVASFNTVIVSVYAT